MNQRVRVIVQARTDSTRLPAKALLPIAGMPSAVLALKRAANTGLDVRLATSDRDIDNRLTAAVQSAGIAVFRGSAENVRQRFLDACTDLNDNAIVVRLTADNLLPDGHLISEIVSAFTACQHRYLNSDMLWESTPYGLSVEVFGLGTLRSVSAQTDSAIEREHVTPALRRAHQGDARPAVRFSPQQSAIRCTMDTFDDYQRMANCFEGDSQPVTTGWEELLDRLTLLPDAPCPITPGPGLVLGTAQIAAPYGSAITVKPPTRDEATNMIHSAINRGVIGIDTARGYDGSEEVIGQALSGGYQGRCQVITKIALLDDELPDNADSHHAADAAEISLLRSLNMLGNIRPDVLLHRAAHLEQWDGQVWARLRTLRNKGLIGEIGVSIQSPVELELALATPGVSLVQMPCNLLDWRWQKSGLIEKMKQSGIAVHVRSVLLQGTLTRTAPDWPAIPGLNPDIIINFLKQKCQQLGRQSIADLCIAWMRAQPWVDALVIGAESRAQLDDTLQLFSRPPLEPAQAQAVNDAAPMVPEQLLNPACWPGPAQS